MKLKPTLTSIALLASLAQAGSPEAVSAKNPKAPAAVAPVPDPTVEASRERRSLDPRAKPHALHDTFDAQSNGLFRR